ncbi:MAG: hypothetical protein U1F43_21785 [Myxococcota bacterium]
MTTPTPTAAKPTTPVAPKVEQKPTEPGNAAKPAQALPAGAQEPAHTDPAHKPEHKKPEHKPEHKKPEHQPDHSAKPNLMAVPVDEKATGLADKDQDVIATTPMDKNTMSDQPGAMRGTKN